MPTPDAPRMAIVGAGPVGPGRAARADGGGLRRDRVRARRAHRRGVDARGAADRRVPLAAPDHQPAAHRVRRAPDARRHARLPEPRRRRAATSRTTPSASACASGSGSAPGSSAPRRQATAAAGSSSSRAASASASTCSSWPTATTRMPTWPDPPYPGDFAGEQLHALDYERRRATSAASGVLVVGMGNSAMDIATDLSHVRRAHAPVGAPRQLGDPQAPARASPPTRSSGRGSPCTCRGGCASRCPSCCCASPSARPSATGCPRRSAGSSRSHPTISDTIAQPHQPRARSRPSPGSTRSTGDGVRFADGSARSVDAIVWCTGYRVTIPFLDQALVGEDPRELPLYKRVFHLERRRPVLRRAHAVHGLGVPDRRAAGAAARRAPARGAGRRPSPARDARRLPRRRRAALRRWGAARAAGDARGLRRLHARARPRARARARATRRAREPPRAGHRRQRRVRHRAARASCAAAAGGWWGSTCVADPDDRDVLACDVTDADAVPGAVAEAIERLGGRLDALVNNAGIGGPASAGAAAGRARAPDARRQPARAPGA